MSSRLVELVAEVLAVDVGAVTSATGTHNEARWDSLRHMQIIFAVEDVFGVRFRDEEIPLLTSIQALSDSIASHQAAAKN